MNISNITIHMTRQFSMVLAAGLGLAAGACANRTGEPDISEHVEQACTSQCNVSHECGTNEAFDTADECISACVESERWADLNQCTTSELNLDRCFGTLSCEELDEYNTWVFDNIELREDWPCLEQLADYYNCDPNQPFEEPE